MSNPDSKSGPSASQAAGDVEQAIEKLKGNDRVGSAGQVLATAGGAAAGASAAGAVAAAAGASTLLGSTTLAGVLGGVFVTTTPIGWVVGAAAVGAAVAYGVSELVRSGGHNDRVRKEIVERLSQRLRNIRSGKAQPSDLEELRRGMAGAIAGGQLSAEQATRLVDLVEARKLDVKIALVRISAFQSAK